MAREIIKSVRLGEEEAGQFERAAKALGKGVSEWLRDLGVAAVAVPSQADRTIEGSGSQLDRTVGAGYTEDIWGPGLGPLGLSERLEAAGLNPPADKGQVPWEPAKVVFEAATATTRHWLPELTRLQQIGEEDPGTAADEFQTLLGGEIRFPKGWLSWDLRRRAAWLDEHRPLKGGG